MLAPLDALFLMGAGLAAALVAGVFLTFSDFAMRSFAKAGPAAGAEAMKHINREIIRSAPGPGGTTSRPSAPS